MNVEIEKADEQQKTEMKEKYDRIMEQIENNCKNNNNKDLALIIEFMKEKGVDETFSMQEIQQKV